MGKNCATGHIGATANDVSTCSGGHTTENKTMTHDNAEQRPNYMPDELTIYRVQVPYMGDMLLFDEPPLDNYESAEYVRKDTSTRAPTPASAMDGKTKALFNMLLEYFETSAYWTLIHTEEKQQRWQLMDKIEGVKHAALQPVAAPDMVMVPREPTMKMKSAGLDVIINGDDEAWAVADIYRAMIAAAGKA